jgi:hypothetical protein
MIPDPAVADRTQTRSIRANNRRATRRLSAIANVMDRLDVFAALIAMRTRSTANGRTFTAEYEAIRRDHAERVVDAVLGIVGVNR